jgi:general stress protein 26
LLDNQQPPTQPVTSALPNNNPQIADDNDLIEKEWVTKAKEIVEKTKHDPHLETKEINLFRADYLKKRYNKELKVAEQ